MNNHSFRCYCAAAFVTALCAAALCTLCRAFPGPATAVLTPQNQGPWEMGKAVFFPFLAGGVVLWRGFPSARCGTFPVALLSATAAYVALSALLHGAMPAVLWCVALAVGLAIHGAVRCRLRCGFVWYGAAILLGLAFLLVTARTVQCAAFTLYRPIGV